MLIKIFKFILNPLNDLIRFFIIYMPGKTGIYIRRFYYGLKLKSCGRNLVIDIGVSIDGLDLITIGDNVCIDKFCIIATGKQISGKVIKKNNSKFTYQNGEIIIGSNVHIVQFVILMGYGGIQIANNSVLSASTKIYSLTNMAYDIEDKSKVVSIIPYDTAPSLLGPVVLGENVWIGLNNILMPGITIEKNSFSTSNSLIVDSFSENSYISGDPAILLRNRFQKN